MMNYAKDNTENNKSDSALSWVVGTVITGMLPYLVMFIGLVANEFNKSIWSYYADIADTAAFMYSVSLCLLLLCVDDGKKIDGGKRKRWKVVSFVFTILGASLYVAKTILDVEKVESSKNADFPGTGIILISLVMLAITVLFVYVGYNLIKEHEKKCSEGENKGSMNKQGCRPEKSELENRKVKNERKGKRRKKK